MDIEKEIFRRSEVNYNKLLSYGFKKENNLYKYSKIFMNGNFEADIVLNENGEISGNVIDLDTNEEYLNIRVKIDNASFSNQVRESYKDILNDIKLNCFDVKYFISNQANRITHYIIDKYNDKPEFLWDKYDGCGVFRKKTTNKWYGIIMDIDKSKIDNGNEEIEIINLKVDKNILPSLLKKNGYFEAYHMNKKNWISIILDETVSDDEIYNLINQSYNMT